MNIDNNILTIRFCSWLLFSQLFRCTHCAIFYANYILHEKVCTLLFIWWCLAIFTPWRPWCSSWVMFRANVYLWVVLGASSSLWVILWANVQFVSYFRSKCPVCELLYWQNPFRELFQSKCPVYTNPQILTFFNHHILMSMFLLRL